jgi:hypothetical protein
VVLDIRDGDHGQGIQRRGTRPYTFVTQFGTVSIARIRIGHRADGRAEIPHHGDAHQPLVRLWQCTGLLTPQTFASPGTPVITGIRPGVFFAFPWACRRRAFDVLSKRERAPGLS